MLNQFLISSFYRASYASTVYAVTMRPSVHLSVRLSQVRSSTKMAKPRITLTMPYNSPGL